MSRNTKTDALVELKERINVLEGRNKTLTIDLMTSIVDDWVKQGKCCKNMEKVKNGLRALNYQQDEIDFVFGDIND